MDAVLAVRLLGQVQVRRGDDLVPLESARIESLLAYLLLHREQPLSRQSVAFALWPDSTEAQALTNLRHVLHNVRRALPEVDEHVEVTPRTLRWRPDPPCRLDVAEFEAALAREDWQGAVEAYGGDLLPGRADDWIEPQRARLRRGYLDALERLAQTHGDPVKYAERLLREEPLREESYRVLMRLHDAHGDRTRAVRVYHECAATLERELAVEPAAATRAVYDALLARDDAPMDARVGGTPFVGRAVERAALTAAWRRACAGRAEVVLLAGEPGIGKTRLAEEFRAWCAHRGAVTALARAYPGEGALAYGPVVEWLRAERLTPRLRSLAQPYLTELARLLPELLAAGVPAPERLPESEQRQRLYDAVAHALVAPGNPLLLVADDLQWWDGESLQLLHYLPRTQPAAALLVVGTARREDATPEDLLDALRAAERLTEIDLERLDRTQTALLAEQFEGSRLAEADVAALYGQTEGNPLFVVEALRADWRAGGVLTPKVQAVIQSRLARLSPGARELVELAAIVGREFTADVLARAGGLSEDVVVRGLDELWRRRIVREHGTTGYDFSHDKIREAAHTALSPMRRRYLHGQVARALQADPGDAVLGRLARHYDEAGAVEQAVTAYARAADIAQRLYAHAESAAHLTRALELLPSLPESPQRAARELELATALLAPLVATEGYASPRIHHAHQQALTLAQRLGVEPSPPLLRSLGLGSLARGEFAAAREHGVALRERGDRDDDDLLRVEGEYLLGVTAFWAGDLPAAREHLERAVELYRDENRREHLLRYAQDPQALCLTRLALTHFFLGDEQAAIRARDRGLTRAEEIGHPYSLATSLFFASMLALDMADEPALRKFVTRGKAALPPAAGVQVEGAFEALDGYLDVLDGRSQEGIARVRKQLATAPRERQAAPGLRSALLRILLAACDAAGDAESGLAAAEELIGLTNSLVWRPEAERLRAKFRAMRQPANA